MTVGPGSGVELARRVAVGGGVGEDPSGFAVGPKVTPLNAGSAAAVLAHAVSARRKNSDIAK